MDAATLTSSVKVLRTKLGDTQTAFAKRLKVALPTAVRYESTRAPKGKILAQLAQLATAHQYDDLARVFRAALAEENGTELPIEFQSPEERELVLTLLGVLRSEHYTELARTIRGLLKEPRERIQKRLQLIFTAKGVERAMYRLLEEGRSVDNVAEMLGIDTATVKSAANWQTLMIHMKAVGATVSGPPAPGGWRKK